MMPTAQQVTNPPLSDAQIEAAANRLLVGLTQCAEEGSIAILGSRLLAQELAELSQDDAGRVWTLLRIRTGEWQLNAWEWHAAAVTKASDAARAAEVAAAVFGVVVDTTIQR